MVKMSDCSKSLNNFIDKEAPPAIDCIHNAVKTLQGAFGLDEDGVLTTEVINAYMGRLALYLAHFYADVLQEKEKAFLKQVRIKLIPKISIPANDDDCLKIFNPNHQKLLVAIKEWITENLVKGKHTDLYSNKTPFGLASLKYQDGDGNRVVLDNGWINEYLNGVSLLVSVNGRLVTRKKTFHKAAALFLYGGLLEASILTLGNYSFDVLQTWVPRYIKPANGPVIKETEHLSIHTFGLAIDINPKLNERGVIGDVATVYGPPLRVYPAAVIEGWGFCWGGRWGQPGDADRDPMHFQFFRQHVSAAYVF